MNYPPYEEQQKFDQFLLDVLLFNPIKYMEGIKKSLDANPNLTPQERHEWYLKIEDVVCPKSP